MDISSWLGSKGRLWLLMNYAAVVIAVGEIWGSPCNAIGPMQVIRAIPSSVNSIRNVHSRWSRRAGIIMYSSGLWFQVHMEGKKEGCISSSYARKPPPRPRRRKVDVCYSELQVPRPFSSAFPCCFFFLAAHSSVENRSDNYSSIELTPLPWDRHKQWVIAAGQLHLLRSSNSSHPALMQLESRNYVPTLFWQ